MAGHGFGRGVLGHPIAAGFYGLQLFLQSPAPFDGLGNASPPFRREVPIPWRVPRVALEHGARLFQQADLTINLGQNLENSHRSSCVASSGVASGEVGPNKTISCSSDSQHTVWYAQRQMKFASY